jgi:hypothetical protein
MSRLVPDYPEIMPIREACGDYCGLIESAHIALTALIAAGVTGEAATRIAAGAVREFHDRRTQVLTQANRNGCYPSQRDIQNERERDQLSIRLAALAEPQAVTA